MITLSSEDLFNMPSFKAFCDDIGVDTKLPILGIEIQVGIQQDAVVKVTRAIVDKTFEAK